MDFGAAVSSGRAIQSKVLLNEAQVLELGAYRTSDAFSELERQVLEYADRLTAVPASVPDQLYESLRSQLGEAALVDLTAEIAFEGYRARFNRGFDVSSQGYAEGHVCPLPGRLELPEEPVR